MRRGKRPQFLVKKAAPASDTHKEVNRLEDAVALPSLRRRPVPGKKPRRRIGNGQSIVEFALILPVFLLLVMGIVDFGWLFRDYVTITNSAREGARLGITGATESSITSKTVSTSNGLLTSSNVTVTNAQGNSGANVTVAVSFDYHYITPLGSIMSLISGGTIPDHITLSPSTTMRIE
jgi:Flp pilus assembly protein TadG